MKIRIFSDLHASRRNFYNYNYANEDLIVAAGDIAEGMNGIKFLEAVTSPHTPVLYVPGNHEYYGENYYELNDKFRAHNAKRESHVKVLLNEVYETSDVVFVGSTLWTDFDVYGTQDFSAKRWKSGLNDSIYIRTDNGGLQSDDVIHWNHEAINFIDSVKSPKKMVLITHYCPELSSHPQWRGSDLNPGFITKIPERIHNKFDLHIHGHTHNSMHYRSFGGPLVICNPKGYGDENHEFDPSLVLEV
jgi:Icc-related predicted phosphoesterase